MGEKQQEMALTRGGKRSILGAKNHNYLTFKRFLSIIQSDDTRWHHFPNCGYLQHFFLT